MMERTQQLIGNLAQLNLQFGEQLTCWQTSEGTTIFDRWSNSSISSISKTILPTWITGEATTAALNCLVTELTQCVFSSEESTASLHDHIASLLPLCRKIEELRTTLFAALKAQAEGAHRFSRTPQEQQEERLRLYNEVVKQHGRLTEESQKLLLNYEEKALELDRDNLQKLFSGDYFRAYGPKRVAVASFLKEFTERFGQEVVPSLRHRFASQLDQGCCSLQELLPMVLHGMVFRNGSVDQATEKLYERYHALSQLVEDCWEKQLIALYDDAFAYMNHSPNVTTHRLRRYGKVEHYARFVAYNFFSQPNGRLSLPLFFPVPDPEKGKVTFERLHPLLSEDGLHCGLVKPLDDNVRESTLLFRGTYDLASLRRDFSPMGERGDSPDLLTGPGRCSFQSREELLIKAFEQALGDVKGITLKIVGHSLGASDGQRAAELLLRHPEIARRCDRLDLHLFNAPGIESDIAARFMEQVRKMETIQFSIHYWLQDGDLVPNAGSTYLGFWEGERPENLHLSIIRSTGVKRHFLGSACLAEANGSAAAAPPLVAHSRPMLRKNEVSSRIVEVITTEPELRASVEDDPDVTTSSSLVELRKRLHFSWRSSEESPVLL